MEACRTAILRNTLINKYIHTYIPYHTRTEQNRTLYYITYIHTYIPTCLPTYLHPSIHPYIHKQMHYIIYYRRKFRSQTSDNMDRWKAEQGRGREKRKIRRKKSRREKSKKKEDADARKGRKVAKHYVFPMICGSGGSKSRLAKAAGAEPAGQMSDEKLHAVVARSTFWSQNVQSTPGPDHFWKLRCRKSARRCGAKHISKSKCTKQHMFAPLLEVRMLKKCTPLWREARFQVKMHKTHMFAPLLEVRMLKKCAPLWREAHFQVKMYKTPHVRATFGGSDVEKVHTAVARSTFRRQLDR